MDMNKLINEVIPPSDYQHRNGFNNTQIIEKLSDSEKKLLENSLIQKLQSEKETEIDTLIVETLAYLKSVKSVPILRILLGKCSEIEIRLSIATSIFEINQDIEMVDIAVSSVRQMDNKKDAYYVYQLSKAFDYLAKFNNKKTKQLIEEYTSHPEYLISYNAKQALKVK